MRGSSPRPLVLHELGGVPLWHGGAAVAAGGTHPAMHPPRLGPSGPFTQAGNSSLAKCVGSEAQSY